jgi:putative alpha-1,2-mannosidase
MSAWYLFSMLGFYPVNPAGAVYVIGSPFFDRVELDIYGATIVVKAPGASKGREYVKSVKINGNAWNEIEIPHSVLAAGAEIEFEMSSRPQKWPKK